MDLSQINPITLIDQFKAKARSWWSTYQAFQANAATFRSNPAMRSKYDALMSEGLSVRASIERATKAIDSVASIIDRIKSAVGLNGLGFLPGLVVPAAIIATVTLGWRAIDAWEAKAKILQAEAANAGQSVRVELATKLAEKGYSPTQIKDAIKAVEGQAPAPERGLIDQAAGFVKWGAIAFVLIYFGPKIYRMIAERKS